MIRTLTAILALLAWSLWLGGMIALFIFVTTLFNSDRDLAIQAAPKMFVVFQKYQLILAAISLIAVVGWRITSPSKSIVAAFVLFAVAAFAAVSVSIWILPPMEKLRLAGESSSPQFGKLHGESMVLYLAENILLLIAGIMLMIAMRAPQPGRSPRIAPPTAPPA
jgi:hypothetical protein